MLELVWSKMLINLWEGFKHEKSTSNWSAGPNWHRTCHAFEKRLWYGQCYCIEYHSNGQSSLKRRII